jgi:hypothetical protein
MVPVCRQLLALVLVLIVGGTSPALAQNHVVDPGELAAALTHRAADREADRAAVRAALAAPEARRVASLLGLDLGQATTLVGSLDGDDLRQAASAARQVDHELVGGASTVTISTTTIVIGLLVLILLIVALK